MFFLNLSPFEFLALLGSLGGLVSALYLLDRRKRRMVVSTLRFWVPSATVNERRSRRHMQQPWSLLLQLLSLVLLLLALARVQWGTRPQSSRDHVFLVDTSAWSAAPGVLDAEKRFLQASLNGLPLNDRALIVSTGAITKPLQIFTADREALSASTSSLRPDSSAINLERAVSYAQNAQRWSGHAAGGILYIGPARTDQSPVSMPQNLRVLRVDVPDQNVGIRSASAHRSTPENWTATLTLQNYGPQARTIHIRTSFASTSFATRQYNLPAHSSAVATYNFTSRANGPLVAQVLEPDALSADNTVRMTFGDTVRPRVQLVSQRPDRLLPLLPPELFLVEAVDPSHYSPSDKADILLFDEYAPPGVFRRPALFIHPPHQNAPLPVKQTVRDAALTAWNKSVLADSGLRTLDVKIAGADIFQPFKGDDIIASVPAGPVVVARRATSAHPAFIVIGFDLLGETHRADLTTPLLMASALSWLAPSTFHADEYMTSRAGSFSIPLEPNDDPSQVRVTDDEGAVLPFSILDRSIQISTDKAESIRVDTPSKSRQVALTIPDVALGEWRPPASNLIEEPMSQRALPASIDLWRWVAAAGGLSLAAEWLLYGRKRRQISRAVQRASGRNPNPRPSPKIRVSA